MTISVQVHCACGKKERAEIYDEEEIPEQCRECRGSIAPSAPQQQAEVSDMWDLTVVTPHKRKPPN